MKLKPPVDTRTTRQKLAEILDAKTIPFGAKRRAILLPLLKQYQDSRDGDGILVNRRHCVLLKQDPDIRYFIKHGICRLERDVVSAKCAYSSLVVNEGVV